MSDQTQALSLEDRIFILAKTYQSIQQYFAHWQDSNIKPEQLDTRVKEFIPQALGTDDRRAFALLMMEFMAPLQNGHTGYMDMSLMKNTRGLGVDLRYFEGEWIVAGSSTEGIVSGDVITAINDQSIEELYQDSRKYLCFKNDMARRIVFQHFYSMVLQEPIVKIGWKDRFNALHTASVTRSLPDMSVYQAMETSGYWLEEPRIAYIKIPSFDDSKFEQKAIEYVNDYQAASSLIIDVRGNGGGSTPGRLVSRLMERTWRWGMSSSTLQVGLLKYHDDHRFRDSHLLWRPTDETPSENAYTGRVIILCDRNTGSAAEDFVMPFKDNGRATLIGETTFGSTGQPYFYNFGDDIAVRIGTKRDYMPDGSPFEGVGVQPDMAIVKTRNDFYEKRDPVLDKAIELAREVFDDH